MMVWHTIVLRHPIQPPNEIRNQGCVVEVGLARSACVCSAAPASSLFVTPISHVVCAVGENLAPFSIHHNDPTPTNYEILKIHIA